MAKKKKNIAGASGRRVKEKILDALRKFDLIMIAYMLTVLVCVVVGRTGDYDLGKANLHGFALCFLLVPAYLILEVLSLINCVGQFNWSCAGWEAELLGICDILLGVAVWIYIRISGSKRGVSFIKAARAFVIIVVLWGVFQLCCSGALWLWKHGGFSSFNRHLLKSPQTEHVETAEVKTQC